LVRVRRHPNLIALACGVVASAIGIALGLSIHWFPKIASTQAHQIHTLWDVMIIMSVPIFVLVTTVILTAVVRFRMRPGQENMDGPPIHGNTRLEVVWTVIPALLILGLCVYSYIVLTDIEKAPAATKELKLDVKGQQFAWTFTYPKEITGGQPLTTTSLVLPKDESVRFSIVSNDVIHDFWVPDFSMKVDAVPGITTHYRITPNRLGTYPVVCAELCGLGHSVMRSTVRVVSPEAFQAWLKKAQQPTTPANATPAQASEAGKQVFASNGCGGCHTLADAGSTGQIGPDLDTALKGATDAQIKEDIVNPNAKIAQGYGPDIMPQTFGQTISPADLDALVSYLKEATQ
jgi:cytochrome c oxidase subunit 2